MLFALGWPGDELSPPPPRDRAVAASPQAAPRRPQIAEHARNLAQSGVDALAVAARDKCLSSPRDCAALLQTLGGVKGER